MICGLGNLNETPGASLEPATLINQQTAHMPDGNFPVLATGADTMSANVKERRNDNQCFTDGYMDGFNNFRSKSSMYRHNFGRHEAEMYDLGYANGQRDADD